MNVNVLTQLPLRVDLHIYEGDRLAIVLNLTQDGAPYDASGDTFAASFDTGDAFGVDMTDAATGKVVLTMDSIPPYAYSWDCEMASQGQTLVRGKVCVEKEVTP